MISEIEIRLRADIARLQQDMDKARKSVDSALGSINNAVAKTMGALGGLAVGAGAVTFARFIKGSIDAADALNDLSARTQVATEDLAGLQFAAKMTGTTLEGAAGAVNKLSQNIGKETDKFRQLGITAQDPIEAFKQLADIFKAIQDPQQKAAFGAATLGKSWAEVAPLLAEGADGVGKLIGRGKELSGVTDSMVQDAAKFNDKLDELGTIAAGAGTRIASDLLPLLNQLVDDLTATGDGAKDADKGFSLLAETLRLIVLAGGNIAFTFKAVGNSLGGISAQVGLVNEAFREFFKFNDVITNARSAWDKLKMAFGSGGVGDMATADAEKARAAFDKWENGWKNVGTAADKARAAASQPLIDPAVAEADAARAKKAAEFLKADEIAAARKKAADEAAAAAAKEKSAYDSLIASIKEKQVANQIEIDTGVQATESQKAVAKLDAELATGKLVLTKAHEAEVRALLASVEGQDKYLAAAKKTKEAVSALDDERATAFRTALAEAEAAERTAAQYGMTEKAIQKATLARMEERLAQSAALELDAKEVEQLEKLIAAKKRSIAATETVEAAEARKKAIDDAAKAEKDFWESIDKTAHDTFISIANGGKDLAQRLKDTLKNTFFDWLYQMTIKKWIINIGTSVGGTGLSGLAQAATGGGGGAAGGGGTLGMLAGILPGAGQTSSALMSGTIDFGSTFSSGLSALGSGSMSGISAGASSLLGVAGPVVAAWMAGKALNKAISGGFSMGGLSKITDNIGIVGGIANRLFGMKAKELKGTTLTGQFGTEAFAGGNIKQEFFQKGGLFRSDKTTFTNTALSSELTTLLNEGYAAIKTATGDFAKALGVPADVVTGYTKTLNVALTGDAAKDQEMYGKILADISDELATRLVPNLTELAAKGETASATLQRVTMNYTALDAILGALGDSFGAVGVGSLAARERLVSLAGGIDKLAANAQTFAENFLTEAERLAPVQAEVTRRLAEMGLSAIVTNEQFKQVVMGLDLTTEAGAKQYAAMLELSGSFAAVTKGAEAAAQAAKEAEKARQEAAKEAIREAFSALEKAVSARKSMLAEQFQATASSFDVMIDAAKASADRLRALAENLRQTAATIGGQAQTAAQVASSSRMAQQQLAAAAASGRLPGQEVLQRLITSAQRQPASEFASFEEFQRAQLQTAAAVSVLADRADKGAVGADRMVGILSAEKAAAEAAYLREQEQLDALLEAAKAQTEAALGTTQAVLTIPQALNNLAGALSNPAGGGGGGMPGMGGSSGGITSPLGPTAQWWEGTQFDFLRSGPMVSANQTSTMSGGNNAVVEELRLLNTRMESMEGNMDRTANNTARTASSSDQLARQFDQVSAGGNALLTET